jgi:hypothetical protein
VERNVLFHEELPKEAIPIISTDNYDLQLPGMSRRPPLPSVPLAPAERGMSECLLSKECEVEKEIEIAPEEQPKELQPIQKGVSGSSTKAE